MFNPWVDRCEHEVDGDGAEARRRRLAWHLCCVPSLLLVGEAPGWRGARYSGIPFVSERLLSDGVIPRVPRLAQRLTTCDVPLAEASATIVWKALYRLGVAETTIMWNAVQLHPHDVGEPWSNRTPRDAELVHGQDALRLLAASFPRAHVVAVGKKAEKALRSLQIECRAVVRHPANGGATEFNQGLERVVHNPS